MFNQRNKRTPGRSDGFTIVEVLVIVVIIGVLATIIGPRLIQKIGQSKQAAAAANAATIATAMTTFMHDCGGIPDGATVDVLWEKPSDVPADSWHGPYLQNQDQLKDPWGKKFVLVLPPGTKNVDFDIISYGADGKPGGEGENADVVKP